jgi:uncharacterized protein (DUF302 family)/uncharacterized membrane protein YidH (DUF202 family)
LAGNDRASRQGGGFFASFRKSQASLSGVGGSLMNGPAGVAPRGALSDYLAAERTLLAWVRTGLALMGFGFVVARFGLFLQQLQIIQHATLAESYGLSLWFGTALIVLGVLVNLFSGWQYAHLVRELDRGEPPHSSPAACTVTIAVVLAVVGLAMAIYLLSVRDTAQPHSVNTKETFMAPTIDNGIVNLPSNHSVDETVQKLQGILQAKSVTRFALVDHSGEAEKVGMKMRPTKLLIFGSPKAGTPLMLAVPGIAIDLPLKILVWEDTGGKAWVSYNSPAYLQQRHGLPQDLLQNIAAVETLAAKAGQ